VTLAYKLVLFVGFLSTWFRELYYPLFYAQIGYLEEGKEKQKKKRAKREKEKTRKSMSWKKWSIPLPYGSTANLQSHKWK
jgi:hypothetical protein